MRKLLYALPLVAGASWAGTTYYSGTQAEPAYDKLLSQLNQLKPLQFVSEEYESGYMQSTAVTKVLFEGMPEDEPLFRLQHVIEHSPVGVDNAGTRIGANSVTTTLIIDEMPPELEQALNGQDPMVLHTRVELSGKTLNELDIAKLAFENDSAGIKFDGGNFTFTSEAGGRIHGGGTAGQLTFVDHDKGEEIQVAQASLFGDMQYVADGIYTGAAGWDFPSLSFTGHGEQMSVEGVRLLSSSSVKNDMLEANARFTVAKIDAPIPVTSASWDMSMDGFPVAGLVEFEKVRSDAMSLQMHELDAQAQEEMMNRFIEAYKGLLAPGAGFDQTLVVSNQGGDMAAKFGVEFKGDGSNAGLDNMQTVRDLMNAIVFTGKLNADAPAVELTPAAMFLGHPMAQQYIINDGAKYTSDLKFDNLLLYANGETVDIVEMFGLAPMLDQPLNFAGNL